MVIRVGFMLVALFELITKFEGDYLWIIVVGTTPFGMPGTPMGTSLVLGGLALLVTALGSLLLPVSALLLIASIGFLTNAGIKRKTMRLIIVTALSLLIVAASMSAVLSAMRFIPLPSGFNPSIFSADDRVWWLKAVFGMGESDWGLVLLHLPYLLQLWADIDYGSLIGFVVLGYAFLKILAAWIVLEWAKHLNKGKHDISLEQASQSS